MEYESGTKVDRPEWLKLSHLLKEGDFLISTEISRFTRSTKQLCDLLEFIKNIKIRLEVGSFVVNFRQGDIDPMTDGMLKMMGVFAELEKKHYCSKNKKWVGKCANRRKNIGTFNIYKR